MLSNLSHTAWIDIFDDSLFEETAQKLLPFQKPN